MSGLANSNVKQFFRQMRIEVTNFHHGKKTQLNGSENLSPTMINTNITCKRISFAERKIPCLASFLAPFILIVKLICIETNYAQKLIFIINKYNTFVKCTYI